NKAGAVYDFIKTMHSYGITSVCDITLPGNLEVYKYLSNAGKLNIRINSYLPIMEHENIDDYLASAKNIDDGFFKIKGFKIFYDGSLGSQSGYFKENYINQNHNGIKTEIAKSGKLPGLFRKLDEKGWQLITHAIGDKAVDETLGLYEELVKFNGYKDRRARIEHAQHIDENDFLRFKHSNIIISAQPVHLKYDAGLVQKTLPIQLLKRTHNYGKLINSGVKICFGTDFPIVEINPFENIQEAMTRETNIGVFTPENKIDLNTCVKCYTTNGAYASFNDKLGLIEKGKKADFVILDNDIFSVPEKDIQTIKAEETYINGERVYSIYD
ncbi:MAG: amidohydrolase, partial [Ignavibacteria bacterium]